MSLIKKLIFKIKVRLGDRVILIVNRALIILNFSKIKVFEICWNICNKQLINICFKLFYAKVFKRPSKSRCGHDEVKTN